MINSWPGSGPIGSVSRFYAECRSYCIQRRHLVPILQTTHIFKSRFLSVKHDILYHGVHNSHFFKIWPRQKRCAVQFGAGCTDCQLEISVLSPFCEKTVLGLWNQFGAHMAKCCLIYSVNRTIPLFNFQLHLVAQGACGTTEN